MGHQDVIQWWAKPKTALYPHVAAKGVTCGWNAG